MDINLFIKREYKTADAFTGINAIKETLMQEGAIVVLGEDDRPLGVLTQQDVLRRPHNLVIDCLTEKAALDIDCQIETALQTMLEEGSEALPVHSADRFEGILFKNDLVDFLASLNAALEKKVVRKREKLREAHSNLEKSEKILSAVYNSCKTASFIVAEDYSILFLNREAYHHTLHYFGRELQTGNDFFEIAPRILAQPKELFIRNFKLALQDRQVISEHEMELGEESFWHRTEYSPVYDNDHLIGVSITLSDISARKRDEIFIQQQNRILKEIIRDQSHGLRRPVANILGIVQLFAQKKALVSDTETISMLESSAAELDQIVREIVRKAQSTLISVASSCPADGASGDTRRPEFRETQ